MTLLLDQAFIPKARKPVTDQELEESETESSQEESTPVPTGNNTMSLIIIFIIYMYVCIYSNKTKIYLLLGSNQIRITLFYFSLCRFRLWGRNLLCLNLANLI